MIGILGQWKEIKFLLLIKIDIDNLRYAILHDMDCNELLAEGRLGDSLSQTFD